MSRPARALWIEIQNSEFRCRENASRPARALWIEIHSMQNMFLVRL